MKLQIAVTFEYLNRPPDTFKTTLAASAAATCVARAIKQAQKAVRPRNWTTMVAVVLERMDSADDETSSEVDEAEANGEA